MDNRRTRPTPISDRGGGAWPDDNVARVDVGQLRNAHWDLRWSLAGGGISFEEAREANQKGNLSDLIRGKLDAGSGGSKALKHALVLVREFGADGGLAKVLDADGLAPSLEAAMARGGRSSRSYSANAGSGGVNFAAVHAKLDSASKAGERTSVRSTIEHRGGDAALYRLAREIPEKWSVDAELLPALELLTFRFLVYSQNFGYEAAAKNFLTRAEQLTRATGPQPNT